MLRRMLIYVRGYLLYCEVAGALDVCDNDVINTILREAEKWIINFIFFSLNF